MQENEGASKNSNWKNDKYCSEYVLRKHKRINVKSMRKHHLIIIWFSNEPLLLQKLPRQ